MSLHKAAQHLSAHGRGPDTTLVHMSEGEVKSLNDIAMAHGGHLTINPHTGLPEAGFLSKMLPMIAGGALAATGVGAPMAALIVGGGYAAATGDIKKGLMAGLGAYGGAGIAGGLGASGASALESQAANAATQSSEYAAQQQLAQQQAAQLGQQASTMPAGQFAQQAQATTQPLRDMTTAAADTARAGSGFGGEAYNASSGSFGNRLSTMGEGVKSLGQPGGFGNFMTNLENVPGTYGAKTTLAAAAAPLLLPDGSQNKPKQIGDSDPGQQYTYQANPTMPTPVPDPYGREQRYFNPTYVPRMASGGLSDAHYNLGGYSDGGRLLRGPGDGVSDSIPAVIGKKQPARLADGEFVVPARIVSELGNGSTEAGARKLYAMMDRIQKARGKTVGKGKVAKNSQAEKHLPA